MLPYINNKDRKRRNDPFDFFEMDENFEKMLRQIQKMWEMAIQDIPSMNIGPDKSFIYGLNVNIGPDGKPNIQEFGNLPKRIYDEENPIPDDIEPLTDVIEDDEYVSITVEIPGVDKDDIDLDVKENTLEINVEGSERKYHKLIDLPSKVFPDTAHATYKNGVLDIILKRRERKKGNKGYSVNID